MAIKFPFQNDSKTDGDISKIQESIRSYLEKTNSGSFVHIGSPSKWRHVPSNPLFILPMNLGSLEILGVLDFDSDLYFVVRMLGPEWEVESQTAVLDSLDAVKKINEWADGLGITTNEMIERIIYRLPENPFNGCNTLPLTYEEHERRMKMIEMEDFYSPEKYPKHLNPIILTLPTSEPFLIDTDKYLLTNVSTAKWSGGTTFTTTGTALSNITYPVTS